MSPWLALAVGIIIGSILGALIVGWTAAGVYHLGRADAYRDATRLVRQAGRERPAEMDDVDRV